MGNVSVYYSINFSVQDNGKILDGVWSNILCGSLMRQLAYDNRQTQMAAFSILFFW